MGERPVSPFEQAFAGLVLGGEVFIVSRQESYPLG